MSYNDKSIQIIVDTRIVRQHLQLHERCARLSELKRLIPKCETISNKPGEHVLINYYTALINPVLVRENHVCVGYVWTLIINTDDKDTLADMDKSSYFLTPLLQHKDRIGDDELYTLDTADVQAIWPIAALNRPSAGEKTIVYEVMTNTDLSTLLPATQGLVDAAARSIYLDEMPRHKDIIEGGRWHDEVRDEIILNRYALLASSVQYTIHDVINIHAHLNQDESLRVDQCIEGQDMVSVEPIRKTHIYQRWLDILKQKEDSYAVNALSNLFNYIGDDPVVKHDMYEVFERDHDLVDVITPWTGINPYYSYNGDETPYMVMKVAIQNLEEQLTKRITLTSLSILIRNDTLHLFLHTSYLGDDVETITYYKISPYIIDNELTLPAILSKEEQDNLRLTNRIMQVIDKDIERSIFASTDYEGIKVKEGLTYYPTTPYELITRLEVLRKARELILPHTKL